jgi:glycopeptide antibiotics resistance protein
MLKVDNTARKNRLPRFLTAYSARLRRRRLLLVPAVLLVLFPFGRLAEQWPAFGFWLDRVFATELAHAIGHGAIFFALGMLLLGLFPGLCLRLHLYLGLLLSVALGQECLQLLYKQRVPAFDDARDLLIDLLGIMTAFLVVWIRQRRNPHA